MVYNFFVEGLYISIPLAQSLYPTAIPCKVCGSVEERGWVLSLEWDKNAVKKVEIVDGNQV